MQYNPMDGIVSYFSPLLALQDERKLTEISNNASKALLVDSCARTRLITWKLTESQMHVPHHPLVIDIVTKRQRLHMRVEDVLYSVRLPSVEGEELKSDRGCGCQGCMGLVL
jgi:hypothetical protein